MAAIEEQEEEPVAKKLRCSEPDLCVIVGQDEDKKEYQYHYQVLASHSNYIDAMLAAPMKESQTMEIKFPDLVPDTWESMISFLMDSAKARGMTVADVMKVAEGYDKYECPVGLQLCDQILSEIFEKNLRLAEESMKPGNDLNLLIDSYILADKVHLEKAEELGKHYFTDILHSVDNFGRTMFTEDQIEKLVPLIAKEDLLRGEYTKEEIMSPMFSKYLVSLFIHWEISHDLTRVVRKLMLSGTDVDTDNCDGEFEKVSIGVYERSFKVYWDDVYLNVKIEKLEDDWVIYGETPPEVGEDGEEDYESIETRVLWKRPYSKNLPLPPRSEWEPVDRLAKGNPKIRYLYRD